MRDKILTLSLIFIFFCIEIDCQSTSQNLETDSLTSYVHKRPWLAAADVIMINTIVNRFDAWIYQGGADFAKVSPASWKSNLEHAFEWDWNTFSTNWFGHPFHGSLYYNSARTSGLNFWESAPYAMVGSLMWEYLGEVHPPSGNDFINTSLGGIFLGEMFYRLSELVLDDRTYKGKRLGKEIGATVLNPMGGINRLITGSVNDHTVNTSGHIRSPYTMSLSLGGNFLVQSLNTTEHKAGPYIQFQMLYGDAFANKKIFKPFDFFNVDSWIRFRKVEGKRTPYLNLKSYANLWAKNIYYSDKRSDVIGVYQHYDYLQNELVEIGSIAFSFGWLHRQNISKKWTLSSSLHLGYIILGGSNSEIALLDLPQDFDDEALRDYILGPGIMAKLDVILEHPKAGQFVTRFNRWSIFVTSGPEGRENVNLLLTRYSIPVWKKLRLGVEYLYYHRVARYDEVRGFERVQKNLSEFRSFLNYRF